MDIFSIVMAAIQIAPKVQEIVNTGLSFKSVVSVVTDPTLLKVFSDVGSKMFPKADPALHAVAAIISAYNPDYTKWLQNSLNHLVTPSPNLTVDGKYGPKTRAAVEALQTKLGLKVDGYAGDITSAAIQTALAKVH